MKSHFHMKGWAPRLALRKRLKEIRKWPIVVWSVVFNEYTNPARERTRKKDHKLYMNRSFASAFVEIYLDSFVPKHFERKINGQMKLTSSASRGA